MSRHFHFVLDLYLDADNPAQAWDRMAEIVDRASKVLPAEINADLTPDGPAFNEWSPDGEPMEVTADDP